MSSDSEAESEGDSCPYQDPSLNDETAASRTLSDQSPFALKAPSESCDGAEDSWEEEGVTEYEPKKYYAVRLGGIIEDRYEVIGKLGYGMASTVWLCKDRKRRIYVVL